MSGRGYGAKSGQWLGAASAPLELLLHDADQIALNQRLATSHVAVVAADEQGDFVQPVDGQFALIRAVEPVGVLAEAELGVEQADFFKGPAPIESCPDVIGKGLAGIAEILTGRAGLVLG